MEQRVPLSGAPAAILAHMRILTAILAALLLVTTPLDALQRRRAPARRAAPVKPRVEPANVTCPESLGTGVRSGASYCFVMAGRDPAEGVLVPIPRHAGEATLRFNLHNRHTYSEEQMKAGRGFAKYTAVVGVLTMKGELLARGAVQTEFRSVRDIHERISGGAGPGGVKAVAPVGSEPITVTIPATVDQVSLLGEVLDATTAAGRETAFPGRPVSIVSNITIEYRPR